MNNWTIRQRILASFTAVIGLMIVMGGISYDRLHRVEQESLSIQGDTFPGLKCSMELMAAWQKNYGLIEAQVLYKDKETSDKIDAQIEGNRRDIERLIGIYGEVMGENAGASEKSDYAILKNLRAPYFEAGEEVMKLSDDPKKEAGMLSELHSRLDPAYAQILAKLQSLVDVNTSDVERSMRQIRGSVDSAKLGIEISCAVALACALACGLLLLRAVNEPLARLIGIVEAMRGGDFSRRLRLERRDEFATLADGFNRMADELASLVGQIQKSGIQVNTSVTEIAATTSEIGATAREISATSKELGRTMGEVSAVAEQSATLAGGGQAGLVRMEETMRHVAEAAGSINAKLVVLNEKAGNINQVVTTITKVADQTNLLSLNAAIEAEKAGEYGRGFSVVATEIRRLADQTAVSTYDIEQMVKEIQAAVSAGVMGMDKFSEEVRRGLQEIHQVGAQLTQIIEQVQALAPRIETVNEGMQAQSTGAEQISQALSQLSEAAQQTVESLRQSNLAIDGLEQTAGELRGGVSRFRLHVS